MKDKTQHSDPFNMPPRHNNKRNIIGAIVILGGLLLLLRNLDFGILFPDWLFSWPMILIIVGLVIGVNSKFEQKASIVLLILGVLFLFREITHLPIGGVIFPLGIIIVGFFLITRHNNNQIPPIPPYKDDYDWDKRVEDPASPSPESNPGEAGPNQDPNHQSSYQQSTGQSNYGNYSYQSENYLNVNSAFSSMKKLILSKTFLGGRVSNIFGSVEINLLQADLQQPVVIDVFQLFGSTQIILPSHWQASSDISSLLGDVDDRRYPSGAAMDPSKRIYITGTTLFGGITLKNA